jgi:hypothetical protein
MYVSSRLSGVRGGLALTLALALALVTLAPAMAWARPAGAPDVTACWVIPVPVPITGLSAGAVASVMSALAHAASHLRGRGKGGAWGNVIAVASDECQHWHPLPFTQQSAVRMVPMYCTSVPG